MWLSRKSPAFAGTIAMTAMCFVFASRTSGQEMPKHTLGGTSLADLLKEAEQNNKSLQAAKDEWQVSKQVPTQVSTLPDPQFMVQHVSVGSPRPFAGYTNSDFAYLGLGVSQDIPYPGKLKLKGEVAKRDVDILEQRYEAMRRSIRSGIKEAYLQLAYLSRTLILLESDGGLLEQIEQAADARYRSGMGRQQDLIQAQLERTKLLREVTMHHLEAAKWQAQIKQLLNRPQLSPDIVPVELSETQLKVSLSELAEAAKVKNPDLLGAERMIDKQTLQMDVARKDFYPDFNVQYMWQRTDPNQSRAYYMLTFGVRVPIYRSRKQNPELAQAEASLNQSRNEYQAQLQQMTAEIQTQYEIAEKSDELLKIYNEGLLPQSRTALESGLADYQNNRQEFQPVLSSFLDLLHTEEELWQNVLEREKALAHLEELTGTTLRGDQK